MAADRRARQQSAWQPTSLSVCPLCDKVFTRDAPYKRHISYCRRAQSTRKGRPKSCTACNAAKTKCTFARPCCARCDTKGYRCVYDSPRSTTARSIHPRVEEIVPEQQAPEPEVDQSINMDDANQLTDLTPSSDGLGVDGLPLDLSATMNFDSVGFDSFAGFIGNVLEWQESTQESQTPNATISGPEASPPAAVASHVQPEREAEADYKAIAQINVNFVSLMPRRQDSPAQKHAANLISHIVSAFPQMMLRRHTFPPFIHPYWHRSGVPEILSSCMSVSQLFVSRTAESRPFLWRTVDTELKHFKSKVFEFSREELQQGVQAITIYIIMAIMDQDAETPARGAKLMEIFLDLKIQLQSLMGSAYISETELESPSASWEEWIYAESRRRIGCLWFAINRVFSLKASRAHCAGFDNFSHLALTSAKTAWEARTLDEWETEKSFHDVSSPMATFGDLITAKRQSADPVHSRKLETWEAGVDKLGMMMNIAVELVGDSE